MTKVHLVEKARTIAYKAELEESVTPIRPLRMVVLQVQSPATKEMSDLDDNWDLTLGLRPGSARRMAAALLAAVRDLDS